MERPCIIAKQSHPASRIAAALRTGKRNVISALKDIPATATVLVKGQPTQAWEICALPARYQEDLQAEAKRRGFRDAEHFLATPTAPWTSSIPLAELNDACKDRAAKLQRAMRPMLDRIDDTSLKKDEFMQLGVEHYRRFFGHSISTRHWQRLWDRILYRDCGAEDWERLEIYLDDRLSRKAEPKTISPAGYLENHDLASVISSFKDPARPSPEEVEYLWIRALEPFNEQVAEGKAHKTHKKVKRRLLEFLWARAPRLADSEDGLRKKFERLQKRSLENGVTPSAVKDQRREHSGHFRAPELSEGDYDKIVGHALFFCGGRMSQAWRELKESNQLSAEVQSYYLNNPTRKSYVPRCIRDRVTPEIALLKDIHHGPRQAKLNGAYISRDWSGVAAGDWYQGDDATMPIYYAEPDSHGGFSLMRGQFLLFFLQYLSWQDGGLKKVTGDLVAMFPARIGTASMQKFGMEPGQIYDARQVERVRDEVFQFDGWLLHSEVSLDEYDRREKLESFNPYASGTDELRRPVREDVARSSGRPTSYPASAFVEHCRTAAEQELENLLIKLCLDPAEKLKSCKPWYFPTLIESLRQFQTTWIQDRRSKVVQTALGQLVFEELEFALEAKRMVLLEGLSRMGKTFAAKSWCELHAGQARYVQVPSSNDDITFFRAIARSLGISSALSLKAVQLRERVEYVLQESKLMVVFDEAHYLFPQSNRREALPSRVNWILTALVNQDVPVALVATPQFTQCQKMVEKKTGWASEQLLGRIAHYQPLPESLNESDLRAVAKAILPEGDIRSLQRLALYAVSSCKYLAGIRFAVSRASIIAKKEGRTKIDFEDIERAIQGSVFESEKAISTAPHGAEKPSRGRPSRRPALGIVSAPTASSSSLAGNSTERQQTEPGRRFTTEADLAVANQD